MSDADDELLPLSGVQHVIFCPRQAALIHVERIWLENAPTALGRILHERADLPGRDTQRGVRLGRAVQLRSLRLGLYGVADVVEYHDDPTVLGGTRPYPVEYKRGSKLRLADQVQLCAQAMCLEELHGVEIIHGALYYGQRHRRVPVEFSTDLRTATVGAAAKLHTLVVQGILPVAEPGPKCRDCSLRIACQPVSSSRQAESYVAALYAQAAYSASISTS